MSVRAWGTRIRVSTFHGSQADSQTSFTLALWQAEEDDNLALADGN